MPELYMIYAESFNKIPEFYMIFARKILFSEFWRGQVPPPAPVSYAYAGKGRQGEEGKEGREELHPAASNTPKKENHV